MTSSAFPDPKNPVNPAHKDAAAQQTTDSQPEDANSLPTGEAVADTTPEPPATKQDKATEPTTEEDTQEASSADPQASDAATGGYDDTDTSTSDADVHAL